jgi:hypothetical protein
MYMSRFAMFHQVRDADKFETDRQHKKHESVEVPRGVRVVLPCETSIEKYNKCIQTESDTAMCSKFILDKEYEQVVGKDTKWWGDSWGFTLPGPPIKNKVKSHIPF